VLCIVADGHGVDGGIISEQLRKKFPLILETEIKKQILSMRKDGEVPILIHDHLAKIKECFRQAFITADKLVQKLKSAAHLSGSTLSVVMIDGDYLFCANVGDSRAIILKQQRNNVKCSTFKGEAMQLTVDHKPTLLAEKLRIESKKGVIHASKVDEYGSESGIKRIWKKKSDLPGLAMSRSIGDVLAHSIGVIAEPGMTTLSF
jgi:serine/threonine protein phosphatase PrpC